ncbi:EAL domain-containing protein [Sulfurimonas sp.]|uniref:bifunctional diguanylate cyclase/phosphodiesterase n=1 Tax=Sulfurimonas sp. TaxID=2022749 RepID=UPI003569A9B8
MSDDLKNSNVEELLNRLPGMLYRCKYDSDWTMQFVSEGCKELTGYETEELLYNRSMSYASIIHEDDLNLTYIEVTKALESNTPFSYEYRIYTKDGNLKWVWEQGIGLYDDSGEVVDIEGYITDITYQKKQSDELQTELTKKDKELLVNSTLLDEYKKAVDEGAIVTKTDINGIITYVNDEFCRMSGFAREDVIGKSHSVVRHPQNPNSVFSNLWKTILDKKIWKGVIKNRTKDKKTYYVKSTIVPILDYDGEIKEFFAIRHDVTDLILQEKKIKFQTTDDMTQLPNRQKLIEDLQENKELKLAIINIEKFKEINDYYGFDTGDRLLVELSTMLSKMLVNYTTKLYKLPADEFAVLTDDSIDKESFRGLMLSILDTINSFEFEIGSYSFNLRALSGASMQRNYYINAEMATNHAKLNNEEFVFFDENIEIKEQLENNVNWTKKLKAAIEDDRIVMFAQPIVCNTSMCAKKYECLIRMIDTDGTVISPFKFLTIAKKSRLYPELTKIVIEKSIDYFKDKEDFFSINLTLEDILNQDIVDLLKDQIEKHTGLGQRLIIEIVEDEGIENYNEVSTFIDSVKSLGCKIAIDDFGTGYSNFDYLMKLNVDFIKIDGSIIKNIDHDNGAKIVTELIVDFAKRLNIETIAEFVYSQEIHAIVKEMGIDYSQGFYLGKPEHLVKK